jgi:hypothetical protein
MGGVRRNAQALNPTFIPRGEREENPPNARREPIQSHQNPRLSRAAWPDPDHDAAEPAHPAHQIPNPPVLPAEQYKTIRATTEVRARDRRGGRGSSYLAAFAHDHRRWTSEAAARGVDRHGSGRAREEGEREGQQISRDMERRHTAVSLSRPSRCLVWLGMGRVRLVAVRWGSHD